jgi:hypothetical protein
MATIIENDRRNPGRMEPETDCEAVTVVFPESANLEPLRLTVPTGSKDREAYMAVASAAFPQASVNFEFGNSDLAINASKQMSWSQVVGGLGSKQRELLTQQHGVTEEMLQSITARDICTDRDLGGFEIS